MNPLVWGPSFWFVLHTVSMNYPEHPSIEEKESHRVFYQSVQNILPCALCRQHYKELLVEFPIESSLESRLLLVQWVVFIHNHVNKRLGKPTVTTEEVMHNYKKVYSRGSFCDPAKCPLDEKRWSSTAIAISAGCGTIVAMLLVFAVWTNMKKLKRK